jgi:hypothetical protein
MQKENKKKSVAGIKFQATDFVTQMRNRIYFAWFLFWVRMHLVHRLSCFFLPSTKMVALWTFGSKLRLVWCLEWLTFSPKIGVFPQISHFKVNTPYEFIIGNL